MISTPSCSALASLVPGLSPASTYVVFLDTLPVTLPLRAVIAAAASSRVKPSSVPVRTNVSPTKRAPAADGSGTGRTLEVHTRGAQLLDNRAVALVGEELGDAFGDDAADAVDGRELFARCGGDAVEAADLACQRARGGGPDVRDAEADEQTGQGPGTGIVDRVDEELSGPLADAFERHQLLDGERVDVAAVGQEPRVDELPDALLAETFDVHRATAREVHDALHPLRRAVDVHAMVVRFALEAYERLAAHRTVRGELPFAGATLALREDGPHDLGNHVSRFADDDGVALADILPRDFVLVVQRGETHGGAADEHGLELRERRGASGAPDAHHDVVKHGGLLFGRELERDRPARRLARETELVALREIVDLHDRAVDLVAERVAIREHALAELVHTIGGVEQLDVIVHWQPELRQPLECLVVRPQRRTANL